MRRREVATDLENLTVDIVVIVVTARLLLLYDALHGFSLKKPSSPSAILSVFFAIFVGALVKRHRVEKTMV